MEKTIYSVTRFSQAFSAEMCDMFASRGGQNLSDAFGWNPADIVEEKFFDAREDAETAFESVRFAEHRFNLQSSEERLVIDAAAIREYRIELDENGKEADRYWAATIEESRFGYIKYVPTGDWIESKDGEITMTIFGADGTKEIGETI